MKTKRIIKDQKGGALVEFAIVLSLLVIIAVGIMEFGILLYNKQVITNATREAVRQGITGSNKDGDVVTEDELYKIVNDYCFGEDGNDSRLITFGDDYSDNEFPDGDIIINDDGGIDFTFRAPLKVYVSYDYKFLVPSLFKLGNSITISAETIMKMGQTAAGEES